ncbi:YgaP family membrane protein [Pseudoalteromonas tunicata]|uniref:Inner membrane protein YgaP-like transmembrane domain-containing protein n=1 Tax=Pseudoalteromonas tunicata D2 TaxID=87626 RepID=A4CE76_9GAMM|nr:DUF2892 domain-containing protein [Pseudoalteromonas tunicata]ATC93076.1 hypothetical protein PTUN_a0258 [Pseudoalteromonas tunicata]AXT32151.1 DUF2892 domain-containing protein [Pseudoalteromonas tunicata]EAR26888.1 hypothetical protein PTD2_09918 [Pseudoalteromonas tunicata D2]MDP4984657.1 DUF2892 domain-containing protein [Pseudoalteromonas tunicata]MDP5213609.1 DUF2892 domain-containing protein [Pseudoalteromonas tunicata]
MNVNDALRLIAGFMIIVSVLLSYFVHPYWTFFTLFIALNLIQSAFSKWCPMISLLRSLGLKD